MNLEQNGHIKNLTPILFKIHESSDTNVKDILFRHFNKIAKLAYDNAENLDDLINSNIHGIIYDVSSNNDEYETYDMNVGEHLSFDDETCRKLIINKINEYTEMIIKKTNIDVSPKDFVEAYTIINDHNENNISVNTYMQFIMSCVNKEYINADIRKMINHQVENIINEKLNK